MTGDAALRAVVRGVVQDVSFRYFVLQKARDLGLKGYVHNLPDAHSLEVVAEGSREGLNALLLHLHQGPPEARVEQVDTLWSQATEAYDRFSIAFGEPSPVPRDATSETAVGRNG